MQLDLIISRHPATVEFIAASIRGEVEAEGVRVPLGAIDCGHGAHEEAGCPGCYPWRHVPVLASATAADVRGKVVAGNLPLHLACLCEQVHAVEFDGAPPRGSEYALADMLAAGARLVPYKIAAIRPSESVA